MYQIMDQFQGNKVPRNIPILHQEDCGHPMQSRPIDTENTETMCITPHLRSMPFSYETKMKNAQGRINHGSTKTQRLQSRCFNH